MSVRPLILVSMSHSSKAPRGPSHSQEELGLPSHASWASSALQLLRSSLSSGHPYCQLPEELREVADLPKDTQLVEHSGELRPNLPVPGFLSSWTNW